MNYIFGIGVALWALAGWVAAASARWPLRFVLSTLCVVVLVFCHLSALGIYGLGLLPLEISGSGYRRTAPWPPIIAISFAADCRSSSWRRCSMPARP